MKKIRATFLSAAMLLGSLVSGARTINTLIINRTDGKTDKIAMNADLDISLNEDGDILLVHPAITVSYPQASVKYFSAGFQNFATGKYYIGDHELKDDEEDGIAVPEVDGLEITVDGAVIRISGLSRGSDARLIALDGKEIVRVRPTDGRAEIRTSGLTAGIYLLVAGNTTVKIRI